MRECPYCKEHILDTAIKCKHCGEFLNDKAQDSKATTSMPTEESAPPQPAGIKNKGKKINDQIKPFMNVMAWVFGVMFALAGFGSLIQTPLIAIVFFIMAGLLLPPVRLLFRDKTGISIPTFIRVIAVIVLMMLLNFLIEYSENSKDMKMAEVGGFSTIADFHEAKNLGVSTKADLDKHLAQEKKRRDELRSEKIAGLEKSLTQTMSISDKLNLYEQLNQLVPDNSNYMVEIASLKDELQRYKEELPMRRDLSITEDANDFRNQSWYKNGREFPASVSIKEWKDGSRSDQLRAAADFLFLYSRNSFSRTADEWEGLSTDLLHCVYNNKSKYVPDYTPFYSLAMSCKDEIGGN